MIANLGVLCSGNENDRGTFSGKNRRQVRENNEEYHKTINWEF